jgi:hypothetical protein
LLLQGKVLVLKGKLQGPTDKQWLPVNFWHTFITEHNMYVSVHSMLA